MDPMGIGALDTALSGLKIAQQQLNVVSSNVSNVGTDGYTRKILPQSTTVVGGEAVGVKADTLIRKIDINLARDLWTQTSGTSALSTEAEYLNSIQQYHGAPDKELSVAAIVSKLKDSFSSLGDDPSNGFLLTATVNQAQTVANKINDFADMMTRMRNDAQSEMKVSVSHINDLLEQIADLNKQIKANGYLGKSSANLEDLRDKAVKSLSGEIAISSFTRGDGVLVIQTARGEQLTDEQATEVFFAPIPVGSTTYYDGTSSGIFLGGDPALNPNAVDLTLTDMGGKVGALQDLRDDTLPKYQAQLDEMAHKMAMRFEAQGLRLFTGSDGQVPSDADPVPYPPAATPPGTPVAYVGFASEIRVNPAILADNSLLRTGTAASDLPVLSGSNEVIRRVVQFAFGSVEYQQATGTVDLRSNGTGATTMQDWLGLHSRNTVTGRIDLSAYSDVNALMSSGGNIFAPPSGPVTDQFTITFEEARTGVGPFTITLDLSDAQANFPIGGAITNAADQIAAEINSQIALAGIPASLAASASVTPYGELSIASRGNITIDAAFAGGMQEEGLEFLGLESGTFETTDPYFDVQVGNADPVRVTIEPQDTETEFLDKLEWDNATQTGVPGLYVDMDAATGVLTLRPGNDDSNGGPVFGGDLTITGGSFETLTPANPQLAAIAPPAGSGIGIIEAVFGTADPMTDVAHPAFKQTSLGAGVSLSIDIPGSQSLVDFTQKMVNGQTEDVTLAESRLEDEKSFQDLLQRQLLDESGVNLDEEMANLVLVQTAFSAAARAVTTIRDMFQDLLDAF